MQRSTSPLMDAITNPEDGLLETEKLSLALGVSEGSIAAFIDVPPATLKCNPDAALSQARLRELVGILDEASGVLDGDLSRAVHWFLHQPLAAFNDQTATNLVMAGRADAVRFHSADAEQWRVCVSGCSCLLLGEFRCFSRQQVTEQQASGFATRRRTSSCCGHALLRVYGKVTSARRTSASSSGRRPT